MSMLRKAMTYLGLGPDDEYDDYDVVEPARAAPPERVMRPPVAPRPRPVQGRDDTDAEVAVVGSVRRLEAQPVESSYSPGTVGAATKPRSPVVRAIPAPSTAKPHVVSPRSFNEAQEVADKFKNNVPVIVNMQAIDRELSRRLIDFASGLCYGLGGGMEKVANQVYLLTPSNVEVSPEERRRLAERGLLD